MAKQDYLPKTDAAFLLWFQNFTTELPAVASSLGITAPEVTALLQDYQALALAMQAANLAKQESQEWTAYKRELKSGDPAGPTPAVPNGWTPPVITPRPPGMEKRIRAVVRRIDASPNCTDTIRADLQIVGPEETEPAVIKPRVTAVAGGNFSATIEFSKDGYDGVEIETQRAGESVWTLLAFDTSSPYVDNRAPQVPGQPEQRRYRLKYRDGDGVVGEYSDVITVTVGP